MTANTKLKQHMVIVNINDVVVVTLEDGLDRETSTAHEEEHHSEAADLTDSLNYNISGGMVESITATGDDSLLVTIPHG